MTQLHPQDRHRRRAVPCSDVRAMIGTRGRSRATSSAVVPRWEKQQMAATCVVSAISRAAATMPSATEARCAVREASMIWV